MENRINYSDPAVVRDLRKIEMLKVKYDMDSYKDVHELYTSLISGGIRFETQVGNDFDDEICNLHEILKDKQDNPTSNNKKSSGQNAQSSKKKSSLDDMDDEMRELVIREMKRRDIKRTVIIAITTLLAITCIGYFAIYYYKAAQSQQRYDELAELKGSDALNPGQSGTVSANIVLEDGTVVPPVLDEYITLYNSNQNLIGWLSIDDTNIDYPVMQCGDNEFYLNHNFDSDEDSSGTLFLDCNCDAIRGNDNYIIYGHHLSGGNMFGNLEKYEDPDYCAQHCYIRFDTIYETGLYQVMFAFRSRVYNEDEVCFKYYQFIDVNSEEEFYSYMDEMESMSLYDTGVRAVYGDELLTLSTCDYHETNGRFVVVAKRIG